MGRDSHGPLPARGRRLLLLTLAFGLLLARPLPAGAVPSYQQVDPLALAGHLGDVLATPAAVTPEYWRTKPQLADTYAFPLKPTASSGALEAVRRLRQGEFRPSAAYRWEKVGVPPPWDADATRDRTWDMYRHSLEWVQPLIAVGLATSDDASLQLSRRIIDDWIRRNSTPPGRSEMAWKEHPVAKRLRLFCWSWEASRTAHPLAADPLHLLLASVYQHACYLADDANYPVGSNHGLEMDGALLAAAMTFPEFRDAPHWRDTAFRRLQAYTHDDFSPEGFHLEQSPSYHWLVLDKLAEVVGFLRANGQTVPQTLTDGVSRAAAVWPYLVRGDNTVPTVGDSDTVRVNGWRAALSSDFRGPLPAVADSTAPDPRPDGAHFLLSFAAGYAVFTAYNPGTDNPRPDTHALFKCNSFQFAHFHYDALSFTLYGLGRDWIVDSGKYNYEEKTPERRYMRSARAHNGVLVDEADFGLNPITLVDYGRNDIGDWVAARHQLPQANHTRTFEFVSPTSVWLTDALESTDGKPHTYTQLFHVAPGLKVEQVGSSRLQLTAPNGDFCLLDQLAPVGEWHVITGQKEPYYQGWYSPDFNKLEPIPTLCFTSVQPSKVLTFATRVSLLQKSRTPDGSATTASPAPKPGPTGTPPAPPTSGTITFLDPLDQYRSRWTLRADVVLKRQGTGIRCDIVGSSDTSAGQYGGIAFPVTGLKSLQLQLSFLTPKSTATVFVDGYDASGKRLLRWTRRANASHPLPSRATYQFTPRRSAGGFVAEGGGDPSLVRAVHIFMLITPGAKTAFAVDKVEVHAP